jgi:hypothetical protein
MEQAESSVGVMNDLLALSKEYVTNEQALQARRRMPRQWNSATGYYGYGPASPGTGWPGTAAYNWGNYPMYGYNYVPNTYYGYNSNPDAYFSGDFPITGGYVDPPETPLQREMARTLAGQATPEYAARLRRDYATALARASESPLLAKNLGIKKGGVTPVSLEAEAPQSGRVAVTMKDGREFTGSMVREDNDRLVLDTGKSEIEIRKSETATILKGKAGK